MKQRGHVPLQHRGLRDDPEDNEFVDAGSIRPDGRARITGSVIVGHHTRESFTKAVSEPMRRANGHLRDTPPIPEGISAAEARAGLRAIYGIKPGVTRPGGEQ
jgi:hypothetical protein